MVHTRILRIGYFSQAVFSQDGEPWDETANRKLKSKEILFFISIRFGTNIKKHGKRVKPPSTKKRRLRARALPRPSHNTFSTLDHALMYGIPVNLNALSLNTGSFLGSNRSGPG